MKNPSGKRKKVDKRKRRKSEKHFDSFIMFCNLIASLVKFYENRKSVIVALQDKNTYETVVLKNKETISK